MGRRRLLALATIAWCLAAALSSCGDDDAGTATPGVSVSATPDPGCNDEFPVQASGAGVLAACAAADGSALSVRNISDSVLQLTPGETSGISLVTFFPASASSVSAALLQQTVSAGCDGLHCTLRNGDGAVFSGLPPAIVNVQVQPDATIAGDIASLLGAYMDQFLTSPSQALRQSAVTCAANLQSLPDLQQFPADAMRQLLGTYQPCRSVYQAIFGESTQAPSVADDLVSSLRARVKANFVDELLLGLARAHPRY